MAASPEGTPCWADAVFDDLDAAKDFYGHVLGWTFGETSPDEGGYTQAYAGGKAVAAVVPPMPGQEGTSQWCLHLAAQDASATAARIREQGGELLMEPVRVADHGTMCPARDPGGVVFGVWQAGTHEGFRTTETPGAYCWAEVCTREPEKSDAFFPAVFGYRSKQLEGEMDFRLFYLGERSVLGRMRMTDDFPPEVPPTSTCTSPSTTATPPWPGRPNAAGCCGSGRRTRRSAGSRWPATRSAPPSRSSTSPPRARCRAPNPSAERNRDTRPAMA